MEDSPFPDCHRQQPLRFGSSGGLTAVVDFIPTFGDAQRRQLFSLAQPVFGRSDCPVRNLDDVIARVDAGIAEALRPSAAGPAQLRWIERKFLP